MSLDLTAYEIKHVPTGQGFVNLGNTCYFNSLLQCLLSCPSIYTVLNSNRDKPHIAQNSLARDLLNLWDTALAGKPIQSLGIPIWRQIVQIARKKTDRVRIDAHGQQDAHEGLMMFFDGIEQIPEVRRLFEYAQRVEVICPGCNKLVIDQREKNLVFEAQPDLKASQIAEFKDLDENFDKPMQLSDFISRQNTYIDENHICSECNEKIAKYKTIRISMMPEIFTVCFKKYKSKPLTPFPEQMEFPLKNSSRKLIYRLVAQSEHSGSMGGGHYWAICKRADGWKILNDSSVSDRACGPQTTTYIIFYHFMGLTD